VLVLGARLFHAFAHFFFSFLYGFVVRQLPDAIPTHKTTLCPPPGAAKL
jgi:hypothetical protein